MGKKKKLKKKVDWAEVITALREFADALGRKKTPVRKPKYVKRIRP